jgi:hypothetical protein
MGEHPYFGNPEWEPPNRSPCRDIGGDWFQKVDCPHNVDFCKWFLAQKVENDRRQLRDRRLPMESNRHFEHKKLHD